MSLQTRSIAMAALCLISSPVFAESADLIVSGTIVPGGCVPTFSGGGVVDFGNILADTLNPTQPTYLTSRSTQLSVQCAAPARWALRVTDNRVGTDVGLPAINKLGLGTTENDEKIGHYLLKYEPDTITGDAVAMRAQTSVDEGATWSSAYGDNLGIPSRLHGYVPVGSAENLPPAAIQSFSATLLVHPIIAATNTLTIGDEIKLDGSATIEIVML